jgi:hypothetical protein
MHRFQTAALLHRETDKGSIQKTAHTDSQDGNVYLQRSGNVSQKGLFPHRLTAFCLVNPSGYQPHSMKAAAEEKALGNRRGIEGSSDNRADRAHGEIQ